MQSASAINVFCKTYTSVSVWLAKAATCRLTQRWCAQAMDIQQLEHSCKRSAMVQTALLPTGPG